LVNAHLNGEEPVFLADIAEKMKTDRWYAHNCLRYYQKQGLVEEVVPHYWIVTPKGFARYDFLKTRLEVEKDTIRLPGIKRKQIDFFLWEERKRTKNGS